MNDFDLAPHRPLPPEVRGRMRERVQRGVRQGGPRRTAPLLAAAATVTALAAGAVVFSEATRTPVADSDLGRCWNAIEQEGKADEYPDRDKWRQVAVERHLNDPRVRLLAFRAEGVPLFCGLTAATATVSSPRPPEDAGRLGVRPLLAIPGGPIGGIVEGREKVEFRIQLPDGWTGSTGKVIDGLFLSSGPGGSALRMTVTGSPSGTLPSAEPPYVRYVDAPDIAGDQTSPSGQALAECLRRSATPGANYDTLQPGAFVRDGEVLVAAARGTNQFVLCANGVELKHDDDGPAPTVEQPVSMYIQMPSGGPSNSRFYMTNLSMGGRIHPSVKKLTFSNSGRTVQAGLHDGTFSAHLRAAKLPVSSADFTESSWPIPAKAYDKAGKLIWSGTLEPSGKR